jgi:hypothetical protein
MDDNTQKFYIAEYSALRSQLVDLYKTSNNWMIYVTSANFFLVAWTAKADCSTNKLCLVTSWLPLVITSIGFALYLIHARTIDIIIAYLATIERKFDPDGGFDVFFKKRTASCITSTRKVTTLIYLLQLAFSICFLMIFEIERIG